MLTEGFSVFALRQGALLAGFFDVELNNLLQGAICRLQFVYPVVVDIRQHDIALGVELRPLHEVGQVLLQKCWRCRWG